MPSFGETTGSNVVLFLFTKCNFDFFEMEYFTILNFLKFETIFESNFRNNQCLRCTYSWSQYDHKFQVTFQVRTTLHGKDVYDRFISTHEVFF